MNERNPHYEYPSQPNFGLPILNGIYSRQDDFTLPAPNGFATFIFDATNTPPTHLGFYGIVVGNFALQNEPLENCCTNYIMKGSRQTNALGSIAKKGSYLQLFPNPNKSGILTLQYQFDKIAGAIGFSIFNMEGRKIWYTPLFIPGDAKTVYTTVDLQKLHLPQGMYIIKLTNNKQILTGKLIVVK